MTPTPSNKTGRTALSRHPERGSYDRDEIYRILDEGLVCHVGFVVDGQPFVVPTAYARVDDKLVIHGSVASRMLRALKEDAEACIAVTLLDGLVLARSAFHHSMNYRSVVIFAKARPITDLGEKKAALDALVEFIIPGRGAEARGPSEKELRATEVLEFPISEASAKVRTGPPTDDAEDMVLPAWVGVIPLRLTPSEPQPAPDLDPGVDVPDYVARYAR